MNYAIIAAGEGSRLAKEGFKLPKPMVSLNGEMLIDRLVRIFTLNNATSIQIIINEDSPLLEAHLRRITAFPIQIVKQSTPSSLHSFNTLLDAFGDTEPLCLTTTDTVFREDEFKSFIRVFAKNPQLDGLMAVTSFVDDESPLYVVTDDVNTITAFEDKDNGFFPYVSGGIYCLMPQALKTVRSAVANGTSRMRNFQRQLLTDGLKLKAYEFSKIVDVDHIQDIRTAELFLQEEAAI